MTPPCSCRPRLRLSQYNKLNLQLHKLIFLQVLNASLCVFDFSAARQDVFNEHTHTHTHLDATGSRCFPSSVLLV